MGLEFLLLSPILYIMAFYWFLLLCLAPSTSAEAPDPVLCVVQSPLETPYFTPWLTIPRPALGCSSPYRLRFEDIAKTEVHVLHLVHFGEGVSEDDLDNSKTSSPTHQATRPKRCSLCANKRFNRTNKHKPISASNSHLPPVDMTMNGLWWDWNGTENGTPATLPPPVSLSTLVLVLFADYPIKWRLHALVLPQTSKLIIQVSEDSEVESNFPVQTLTANWKNKTELLQYVRSRYGAITSFTEVDGANQINLKVGYATADYKECNTNSSKKSSVVSASLTVKQKTEGCFHENYIGYNPWDVYVVELNPSVRKKSGKEWEVDGDGEDALGSSTTSPRPPLHPVAVLLEGEGPVPVPRNVTLVLKSGSPIRWRFSATGVDGSIVVVSNQEVENWGAAAAVASIAGGMGTWKSTFGFKRSSGLEVKSRILPDNMDALLEQVASEFGRPVLYAKTASASTLRLLVGNGRHTKLPVTSSLNLSGGGARSNVHEPSLSSWTSSLLGIEPSSGSKRKISSLNEEEDMSMSSVATLQKVMKVECEQKRIVVSFPRQVTDSLGVAWMSFIDPTCSSKLNASHVLLSSLFTSCGSTSKSDGRTTSYSNSVYVKFGPSGSDDEDFDGPGEDESGSEFGSGAYPSEGEQMEESPNYIPIVCRHPPLFPGSGFGAIDFDGTSMTDTVEMSGSSVSEHNKLYHMEVYRDHEHKVSVDFERERPAEVAFHDTLYVKTWIDGSFPIQVVTENCWISNSSDPNFAPRVSLIRNTCPVDLSVNIEDPSKSPKSHKSLHGRFSFQVSREYGNLGNIYVHCRLGVCTSDAGKARGNLVMCVEPHQYCSGHYLHAFLDQTFSSAQQLSSKGPLLPVSKRRIGKDDGRGSVGRQDSSRITPSYGNSGNPGDITDEVDLSAIAGGALPPINQRIPQQVLVVGISTEVAIGIAVASFAIGVGLTISLWCIHIHTDPFRSRRRSNKHLVQVVGVPGGTGSILCEGGGSSVGGPGAAVGGGGMPGGALPPINQRIPQQVLVVGISTEVAIGIAVASFAIGVGLTISLWCIHIHTDPFRSRRRSNKHLVQVVGVPGGTGSILCEGGGSSVGGPGAAVGGGGMPGGGGEGCNLSPRSGCSTTNSQATIAA